MMKNEFPNVASALKRSGWANVLEQREPRSVLALELFSQNSGEHRTVESTVCVCGR